MPGVTKHIFDHEIRDILIMWNSQIKSVQFVLPQYYIDTDIIFCLKHYYPHEWHSVESKYLLYYKKKTNLK